MQTQTQTQRALAYDRYLDAPDMPEWSEDEIKEATYAYIEDVIDNNANWDDDGSYMQDFGIEVECIMRFESREDKLLLIEVAYEKLVIDYCKSAVRNNPNFYCAKYCDTEF